MAYRSFDQCASCLQWLPRTAAPRGTTWSMQHGASTVDELDGCGGWGGQVVQKTRLEFAGVRERRGLGRRLGQVGRGGARVDTEARKWGCIDRVWRMND